VHQRIGRAKEKYPSVQQYYNIEVSEDKVTRLETNISWQKDETKHLDKTDNLGIYFLRTNLNVQDEVVVWNIYNTIREIENTFRTLKTDLYLRPIYHKNDDATMAHLHLGPSTHKDEVYKNNCRDARGIGDALAKGQLKSIYVPSPEQEADRHLVRMRKKIWRDLVRCKNRVKGFLDYVGIPIPQQYDNPNWSHNFIQWLQQLPLDLPASRLTLNYQIREVQLLRR
jgi:hypothetical protein